MTRRPRRPTPNPSPAASDLYKNQPLNNPLPKSVEPFRPLKSGQATIYSCGPTVYDHIHIGNLRAFIVADLLRRSLVASGYTPKHVMNFTDVDDKTIRRSQENYPDDSPEQALTNLTQHYEQVFLADMTAIGNDPAAIQFVRATDSIAAMQQLIYHLYRAGIAYVADDGIYFSIQQYRAAGKTYGQLVELDSSNTSTARINNDEYDKDSAHDFALWKTQKPGEPAWPFQLDDHNLLGRPGWHIECSAMSTAALGQPFDIHTGGIDLVFPHHENEIAQSTATGKDLYARYFVHNEHLLVEGRKMAKSAHNFFTLRDIQERGFEPLSFRILALQAHYRSQLNFSWDSLTAAHNRLINYRAMAVRRWQEPQPKGITTKQIHETQKNILYALKEDIDTPTALASLSQLEDAVNAHGLSTASRKAFGQFLDWVDSCLGLDLSKQTDLTAAEKMLLKERRQARDDHNWQQADSLRDELAKAGIGVRDNQTSQIWFRL